MIKHLNLKIESYGISKFFFYHVPAEEEVDSETINLLTNQKVAGLLPSAFLKRDENIYIRFDKIFDFSLERLFFNKLNKESLITYLLNLVNSLLDLQQKSQLKFENILLNKKYIFLDHFSNRLVFMYIPIQNNVFEKVSMKEFVRDLIAQAPYDEKDDLSFFVKLHNYLIGSEDLDLADFEKWLSAFSAMKESKDDSPSPVDVAGSNFYSPGNMNSDRSSMVDNGVLTSQYGSKKTDKKTGQKLEIEEEVQYKRITRTELGEGESLLNNPSAMGGTSINIIPNLGIYKPPGMDGDNGATTLLGDFDLWDAQRAGTTVLGLDDNEIPQPYLFLAATNEKFVVSKDIYKIGRDPEQADYISNNIAVGRVHAELVNDDGQYFIIDQQSRNGSYLNGKKLLPYEKSKLKHEDIIKLANEEYIFRLF
jgi:hypothetical protein